MGRFISSCIVVLLAFTAPSAQYMQPVRAVVTIEDVPTIPEVTPFELLTKDEQRQVMCLADNVYYEAGVETDTGKVAVAMVTMNRVKSGRYPSDVCSVVRQQKWGKCQFAWWCNWRKRTEALRVSLEIRQSPRYQRSKEVAMEVFQNHELLTDVTNGAMYFHECRSAPVWRRALVRTVQIGRHIFYKV